MVFWIIIWSVVVIITILMTLQEFVNGSFEWRTMLIFFLIMGLILSGIFVFDNYTASKDFCERFKVVKTYVEGLDNMDDETMCLALTFNMNRELYEYQKRMDKFGIFAPYYSEMWKLTPIHLKYYAIE